MVFVVVGLVGGSCFFLGKKSWDVFGGMDCGIGCYNLEGFFGEEVFCDYYGSLVSC